MHDVLQLYFRLQNIKFVSENNFVKYKEIVKYNNNNNHSDNNGTNNDYGNRHQTIRYLETFEEQFDK